MHGVVVSSYLVNGAAVSVSDVSARLVLPVTVPCALSVTAGDVLHSFGVPSFGAKVDANPGQLSNFVFRPSEVGVFVGQCRELCGVGHSFMPIVCEVVPMSTVLVSGFGGGCEVVTAAVHTLGGDVAVVCGVCLAAMLGRWVL